MSTYQDTVDELRDDVRRAQRAVFRAEDVLDEARTDLEEAEELLARFELNGEF